MADSNGRGRPRATSPAVLEEAAIELFLEQGYDRTTVGDIARRAGISRSAFFAYFPAKSDVLWLEIDQALEHIDPAPGASVEDCARAIVVALEPWRGNVPWALRDAEIMGTVEALQSTVVARMHGTAKRLAGAMSAFDPADHGRSMLIAGSLVGTTSGAISVWSRLGRDRGTASAFVLPALERIVRAYGA